MVFRGDSSNVMLFSSARRIDASAVLLPMDEKNWLNSLATVFGSFVYESLS